MAGPLSYPERGAVSMQTLAAPRRRTRGIALAVGLPFLVALGTLTLAPTRVEDRVPTLLDAVLRILREDLSWTWLGFDQLEVIANVVVFIPVGILAFVLIPRRLWGLAFLAGPALSVGIELWQAVALPERAATVLDVLANSAGATLGVAVALLCTLLIPRSRSRRLETP